MSLTPRQADALDFIKGYQASNGDVSPSVREIGAGIGIAGLGAVHRLLTGLEERGFIRRLKHHARAIEIVDRRDLSAVPIEALVAELATRGFTASRIVRPSNHGEG